MTSTLQPTIVDTGDELTPGWFTTVLRHVGALAADHTVVDAVTARLGTGQLGHVVRSELTYDRPSPTGPESVVVKMSSLDPGSRQVGIAIGAYEAEVRFFLELAPRLAVNVPVMHWAAADSDGRCTLVMEDLSGHWRPGNSLAGCTPEQTRAALHQLTRLHAPLWDDSTLRDRDWLSAPERTDMLFAGVPAALPAFLHRFGDRLGPQRTALFERLVPHAPEFPRMAWQGPLTVIHSDYRLDNMLFTGADEDTTAMVIDWQTARLGPALLDVALFTGTSLPTEQRRTHETALVACYHDGLCAAGVRGFSYEDCWTTYRRCSLYAFLVAVGSAVSLEQTERGDSMFAELLETSADMVTDLDAARFLDNP